jgi:uncharacterized protein (TIGR02452 family)
MKFYDTDHKFREPTDLGYTTIIEIMDADTLAVAQQFSNPCCLNFASHKRPGGGYKAVMDIPMPIKTQEEDLFRRSNLPELMDIQEIKAYYPLVELKGFYGKATVNKDAKLVNLEKPFVIGVVTVPAVVNPNSSHTKLIEDKIRRIMDIAADNLHKDLVLGAWGCGVFNNDPTFVAKTFKKFLEGDFKGVFENVVFGIPGKTSMNYKLFNEALAVP